MSNQLIQGQHLLQMRRKRKKRLLSNMSIIDGINNPHQSIAHYTSDSCPRYAYCPQGANALIENFEQRGNCPGQGGVSSCSTTSGCPRYGHCPPTDKDLLWVKDEDKKTYTIYDDGGTYTINDAFNKQLSDYGSIYKVYMENINNYVANPPTFPLGQNVTVPQLGGSRSHCPMCPVDGGWSEWGACDKTCGGGTQTRMCNNPVTLNEGIPCKGNPRRSCAPNPCPIDGGWTPYGACSVTACGQTGTKSRTCTNPSPAHGGTECSGDSLQPCNTPTCPIDGGWTPYGACSATDCGETGTQSRTCTNPSPSVAITGKSYGGAPCDGDSSQPCSSPICAVDGGWSKYSACSVTACGQIGTQSRTCTNPPPNATGKMCSGYPSKSCNTPACAPLNCPSGYRKTDNECVSGPHTFEYQSRNLTRPGEERVADYTPTNPMYSIDISAPERLEIISCKYGVHLGQWDATKGDVWVEKSDLTPYYMGEGRHPYHGTEQSMTQVCQEAVSDNGRSLKVNPEIEGDNPDAGGAPFPKGDWNTPLCKTRGICGYPHVGSIVYNKYAKLGHY